MKKSTKKLDLKKLKIAKLNRLHYIKGGEDASGVGGCSVAKSPNPIECPPNGEVSFEC